MNHIPIYQGRKDTALNGQQRNICGWDCPIGKTGYMAPEVLLHKKEEIGPWTDLYSVSVLWYEILSGETFPEDRELMNLDHLVSPYDPLLLHEKERSAAEVNRILKKGLQFLPANRYRSVEEMLQDVKKLHDIVTGVIREPLIQEPKAPAAKKISKKTYPPRHLAGGCLSWRRCGRRAADARHSVGRQLKRRTVHGAHETGSYQFSAGNR